MYVIIPETFTGWSLIVVGEKSACMPASNVAGLERLLGVRIIGVRSVDEALDELF